MTIPEMYARWAMLADPSCVICKGRGYAYFAQMPPLTKVTTQRPPSISNVTPGSYISRCRCGENAGP